MRTPASGTLSKYISSPQRGHLRSSFISERGSSPGRSGCRNGISFPQQSHIHSCCIAVSLSDRTPNKGVQPIRYRSRLTLGVRCNLHSVFRRAYDVARRVSKSRNVFPPADVSRLGLAQDRHLVRGVSGPGLAMHKPTPNIGLDAIAHPLRSFAQHQAGRSRQRVVLRDSGLPIPHA